MDNFEKLMKIQNIIMHKKFDIFINKYWGNFKNKDIKKLFFWEFQIKTDFSEEYILFLDYLIKKHYVIKN